MRILFYIFGAILFIPSVSFSQEDFNFYISNSGNDANPGTSMLLPKQTLTNIDPELKKYAAINGNVSIGLNKGSVFNDALSSTYPLEVGTYSLNADDNDFAVLNGSDVFDSGWIKDSFSINTFKHTIILSGFTGNGINTIGSYSFVYVTEIDKELEKTAPFTARKLLQFISTKNGEDSLPGSFYEQPTNDVVDPITIFIHTSDGSNPNSNPKYRYEVTVRGRAINAAQYKSRFENLWVMGYGAGQGMIPGGSDSYYNKIIFGPGAAIHHVAIESGTINNSLFLPGAENTDDGAVVFYDVEGLGRTCYIQNTVFMDIPTPIYMHTSYGSNYAALKLNNVVAFADTLQDGSFMNSSNNDTVMLNNVYTDRYQTAYTNWSPKYVSMNNCCFKDVINGIDLINDSIVNVSMNNVYMKLHGYTNGGSITIGNQTSLQLSNSIIHISNSAGNFIGNAGGALNHIYATGNIFITEVDSDNYSTVAFTNTTNGINTSSDLWNNNVYILLKGQAMFWGATNRATVSGNPNELNFTEWQRQSGQDKNSLFFDLRNDPRGLKAIFIDPENGDYELANTPEANQIKALKAGMTTPLTCFLPRPTYEQVADLIRNNQVLTANSCTNPCVEGNIRGGAYLYANPLTNGNVQLQWTNTSQQNIDHYEIERKSFFTADYETISSIPVNTQQAYSFIDSNIPANGIYVYRLAVVATNGTECYSYTNTITVTATGVKQHVAISPNPTSGKINVSLNNFNGIINLSVLNTVGQRVAMQKITAINTITVPIDISSQPSGPYWLKIEASDGSSNVQPFILQ